MANPSITIPLDAQTARAYNSAAPEEKRKIQALLSLWLRELAAGEYSSLQQVLDDVGRKAKDRVPRTCGERPGEATLSPATPIFSRCIRSRAFRFFLRIGS